MTDSNNPRGIKLTHFDTSIDEKQWAMIRKLLREAQDEEDLETLLRNSQRKDGEQ